MYSSIHKLPLNISKTKALIKRWNHAYSELDMLCYLYNNRLDCLTDAARKFVVRSWKLNNAIK